MQFTAEQKQAIFTHDRNLIVVAGAGSGKTRVLVERYLALLDEHDDWSLDSLVAITFTKKAAEEMRDRVRTALQQRYNNATDATERWSLLLSQMDTARIDTIHGLCATLLRANAAEAQIDPDFRVLNEVEAAVLLVDVVDRVFADVVASQDEAVALFKEYHTRHIRQALSRFDLLAHNFVDPPDDIFQQWQAAWSALIPDVAKRFLDEVDAIGIHMPPPNDDKLGLHWSNCLDCLDRLYEADANEAHDLLQAISKIAGGNSGSKNNWGGDDAVKAARADLRAIRESARKFLAELGDEPGILDEKAALLIKHWIRLFVWVQQGYRQVKNRLGVLDFDDLERLTSQLLMEFPHVQARYRAAAFHHVLVDEFQDTNAQQWQLIQALTGSMFVVGDPKQSIYAFRGADVSVFNQVRDQIVVSDGLDCALSTSFRTHQPLMDCFNALFGQLLTRDGASPVSDYQVELGKPMSAFRDMPPYTDQAMACLSLLLIDTCQRDEQLQQVKGANKRILSIGSEAGRRREAYFIAHRIQSMIAERTPIFDRDINQTRPADFGDFTILFQSLTNVTPYEDVFKQFGVPYVTVAGRGFYDRQEIWDLLNLLNVVYNPADDLALASVLRSPLFSLSDDALFALRLLTDDEDQPIPLWAALQEPNLLIAADEQERLRHAWDILSYLRTIVGRITIPELLNEALERTGYLAILTGLPDGARRRGNLEKLLDQANASRHMTLGAFSQYLRDMSAAETHEGEAVVDAAGAVRLMTVHASKGLEFPVVILADTTWQRPKGREAMIVLDDIAGLACKVYDPNESHSFVPTWRYKQQVQRQQMREETERLRLLYVAATRAQDYLILSGQVREKTDQTWTAKGWMRQLFDLLDLSSALEPDMQTTLNYDWGQVQVTVHSHEPPAFASKMLDDGFKSLDFETHVPPQKPLLLNDVMVGLEAQGRHLSATQIADLGSAYQAHEPEDRAFYWERFRRQVFQDAPTIVEDVVYKPEQVTPRQIGNMVHEALQHWQLPAHDVSVRDMLRVYAWRQGITDEFEVIDAINRAYRLLQRFETSYAYQWIEAAHQVYHELPFVYERDGYVIHGVIDVLLQQPDGRWIVMDYKTGFVRDQAYQKHAKRYHLQLGVYADAVQTRLGGVVPATSIHYIRHTQTVEIPEHAWREALRQTLKERILELYED